MFDAIGMEAFAERTRMELVATGLKVRKRNDEPERLLTGGMHFTRMVWV